MNLEEDQKFRSTKERFYLLTSQNGNIGIVLGFSRSTSLFNKFVISSGRVLALLKFSFGQCISLLVPFALFR